MRIILNTPHGNVVPLWIKLRDTGIVGGVAHLDFINRHLGLGPGSEIHFTYPEDGNIHYSIKRHGSGVAQERFVSVFPKHVRDKTVAVTATERGGIDSIDHNLLEILSLPTEPQLPLRQYAGTDRVTYFLQGAYPVNGGRLLAAESDLLQVRSVEPASDDLVVSCSEWSEGTINISIALFAPPTQPFRFKQATYRGKRQCLKDLCVEMSASFFPRTDDAG